jgi:hypothetical protein
VRALAGGVMGGAQLVGRWVESYTGMSPDNIKGLLLALSCSLFIGASFIVKKKGLKKAGASGVRAGEGPLLRAALALALLRWDYAFIQQDAVMLPFAAGSWRAALAAFDLRSLHVGSQWRCRWLGVQLGLGELKH